MPDFASPVRFAAVPALPSAAANARCVLEYGGKLWFSDGSSWIDMTTATSGSSPPLTVAAFRVRNYFSAGF